MRFWLTHYVLWSAFILFANDVSENNIIKVDQKHIIKLFIFWTVYFRDEDVLI